MAEVFETKTATHHDFKSLADAIAAHAFQNARSLHHTFLLDGAHESYLIEAPYTQNEQGQTRWRFVAHLSPSAHDGVLHLRIVQGAAKNCQHLLKAFADQFGFTRTEIHEVSDV